MPTFGCCWNCRSLAVEGELTREVMREGEGERKSRRWDSEGDRIRRSRSPRRSNVERPPSRRRERERRSRMVMWMLRASGARRVRRGR